MTQMKLVRDRIPAIIQADGKSPVYRVASEQEKLTLVLNKLQEEVNEFKKSPSIEEMADILEVLEIFADYLGFDAQVIQTTKISTKQERGGFGQYFILEAINSLR